MKTKRRRVEYISFYNHTGLEEHFTKMAKKGWLIESISNYYWTYRKIEPKDVHFCVTYYPRASDFDPEPSPEQQTFHDFCAHTGWQLTCTWHQMQVFYNEKEDPIPLETDPVLEVETLHKACKKNFLPSYFILLALGLIMGGSFVARIFVDPIGLLSNASQLLTGFCFFCMAVVSIAELTAYFTWYFKAKKAAQDGIFVDTPSTAKLQLGIVVLVLIGLVLWLLNLVFSDDPIYLWVAVLMIATMIALHIAVNSIKQGLKKAKASRGVNRFLTIFASFTLSFILTGGVVLLTLSVNRAGLLERDPKVYTELPLSLSDLCEISSEDYIEKNRLEQSFLLRQQTVDQYPRSDANNFRNMPDLHYTITAINVPILSKWCKAQVYREESEQQARFDHTYKQQDANAWGADAVYLLYDASNHPLGKYLLFFQNSIVELWLDWEPSADQMSIIGQKLNQ